MRKINFIIAAYNEESRISNVIKSVIPYADQIVILDPGSTDETIVKAKQLFPVIVVSVPLDMFDIRGRFELVFPHLLGKSASDWFLGMNCSEELTKRLGSELLFLINRREDLVAVDFYRQSLTLGVKTHNHKLYYVAQHILKIKRNYRLLRMSAWDISSSKMHAEFPVKSYLQKNTTWLWPTRDRILIHRRQGSLKDFEEKHSIYSTNEASEKYSRGERSTLLRMLLVPVLLFFYFIPTMFDSKRSLIISLYHVFYKFQVEAKLYMMEHEEELGREK